ncbi:putative FUN34-transmembrane protein [Mrakia frigida]|uniref:acetate uptake transporter family protein n=1 Tax=Mrakia frigida TaxID=29902 RepID=UPI003FCC09E7
MSSTSDQVYNSFPSPLNDLPTMVPVVSRGYEKESSQHFERAPAPPLLRNRTPGGHPYDDSQPGFPVYHRKQANPAPLGFLSFAITTFVLSFYNCGVRGITHPNVVVGMCMGVGGLAQLLSGMWEFTCGNTFGATAFSSYGTFWISFGLIYWPSSGILTADYAEGELESALGIYLMSWFILTFLMTLATLKASLELCATFSILTLALLLLAVGEFMGSAGLHKAGGGVGVLASFCALYCGLSGLLTPDTSYFLLPTYDLSGKSKCKAN